MREIQTNREIESTIMPHTEPLFARNTLQVPLSQRSKSIFNHTLSLPTDPKRSFFKVVFIQTYRLCDTLKVYIEARNGQNQTKSSGGDYFWAWIHNRHLHASAAADQIVDHENGSYTATFRLHWTGDATVIVQLIHSREAVSVLRYLRDNYAARSSKKGKFISGNITRITPCHVTTDMYLGELNQVSSPEDIVSKGHRGHETSTSTSNGNHLNKSPNLPTKYYRTFCDFTDDKTGFPWFCVKPDDLSCDTFNWHTVDLNRTRSYGSLFKSALTGVQQNVVLQR